MFSRVSRMPISKSKRCFNAKSSTCYFHMKTKIMADIQIYISVPLNVGVKMSYLGTFSLEL